MAVSLGPGGRTGRGFHRRPLVWRILPGDRNGRGRSLDRRFPPRLLDRSWGSVRTRFGAGRLPAVDQGLGVGAGEDVDVVVVVSVCVVGGVVPGVAG